VLGVTGDVSGCRGVASGASRGFRRRIHNCAGSGVGRERRRTGIPNTQLTAGPGACSIDRAPRARINCLMLFVKGQHFAGTIRREKRERPASFSVIDQSLALI
jgi:hypothetical protein